MLRCAFALAIIAGCAPRADHTTAGGPADPAASAGPAPTSGTLSAPPADPAPPATAEQALARARPVFAKYCSRCHQSGNRQTSKKALEHFSLDTDPPGGHHAHELAGTLRLVLGAGGKPATMPLDQPGAVQGDDLAALLAWADAHEAEQEAHHGEGHDHGNGHHEH